MDCGISYEGNGISLIERKPKTTIIRRKRLTDISNLSIGDFINGTATDNQDGKKIGSPVMASEYIAKLLKENNALIRALAEKSTEVQNLRLIVAKLNQQNWQLAQTHSQMLTELNTGKDRLKAAQHEIGCLSTTLKLKTQELQEQKNLNKQNIKLQNTTTMEGTIKPVEIIMASDKAYSCLPNRKRPPQRVQSLEPVSMSTSNQVPTGEEKQRKHIRKKIGDLETESLLRTEDLFETQDAKLSINDGEISNPSKMCVPKTPMSSVKKENGDSHFSSSLRRTSLGRPSRKAAEKINCYKELPLNIKLRR